MPRGNPWEWAAAHEGSEPCQDSVIVTTGDRSGLPLRKRPGVAGKWSKGRGKGRQEAGKAVPTSGGERVGQAGAEAKRAERAEPSRRFY